MCLKWFVRIALFFMFLPIFYYVTHRDWTGAEQNKKYKKYDISTIKIPAQYKNWGIDVSKHNGEIHWDKVSKTLIDTTHISFAFVKATEGYWYIDPEFLDNWHSCEDEKITRSAYHFFRPNNNIRLQAWLYCMTVHIKKGDLPPVLDLESDDGISDVEVLENARIWLQIVENHYDMKPIIYTNLKYFNRIVKGNLENYPLWFAQYRGEKPNLSDDTNWDIWQMSDKYNIEGINEKVDLNVLNPSFDYLESLRKK